MISVSNNRNCLCTAVSCGDAEHLVTYGSADGLPAGFVRRDELPEGTPNPKTEGRPAKDCDVPQSIAEFAMCFACRHESPAETLVRFVAGVMRAYIEAVVLNECRQKGLVVSSVEELLQRLSLIQTVCIDGVADTVVSCPDTKALGLAAALDL